MDHVSCLLITPAWKKTLKCASYTYNLYHPISSYSLVFCWCYMVLQYKHPNTLTAWRSLLAASKYRQRHRFTGSCTHRHWVAGRSFENPFQTLQAGRISLEKVTLVVQLLGCGNAMKTIQRTWRLVVVGGGISRFVCSQGTIRLVVLHTVCPADGVPRHCQWVTQFCWWMCR